MKLALYVEGDTEIYLRVFLKKWLDPQLSQKIKIAPVNFGGVAFYLRDFAARIQKDLRDGQICGAIGLIDLYGSGLEYPSGSVAQKYAWAKDKLERCVSHPKFRQHFAVHETEAWLFSDPNIFPENVARDLPKTSHPESVNFQNPPSKRLKDLYWRKLHKHYRKPLEASRLFDKLTPQIAYDRCPHLKLLLDDLLHLAREAIKE